MFKGLLDKIFPSKKCSCGGKERTLKDAKVGESVTIECLRADPGSCQRLREMGFCESAVVKKIADNGALICGVCDAKVVISRKLASGIVVKNLCCKDHPSSEISANTIFLSQMSVGQSGIIDDFFCESDDCERIEEMGITPGEVVEIVRYAPMGDPIEIKIRGYLLSLRKEEADLIKVKLPT